MEWPGVQAGGAHRQYIRNSYMRADGFGHQPVDNAFVYRVEIQSYLFIQATRSFIIL
jgi:hypothetical protein